MDFDTLQKVAEEGVCTTIGHLFKFLQLIVTNCVSYNGPGKLCDLAKELQKAFMMKLRSLSRKRAKADVFRDALLQVARSVRRHPDSWPFRRPVLGDGEAAPPNYAEIIKRPMDISTIEHGVDEKGRYPTVTEFARDFRLIRDNCVRYHGRESELSVLAFSTWRRFMEVARAAFPEQVLSPADLEGRVEQQEEEEEKEKKKKEEEDGSALQSLESSWKWGFVLMWCETFGKFMHEWELLKTFAPRLLQDSLTGARPPDFAANLARTLLQLYLPAKQDRIDEFSWERELATQITGHLAQCGLESELDNPLAARAFSELSAPEKVRVLSWLCEWNLAENELVRELVVYDERERPFASEPLASDQRHRYWSFSFDDRRPEAHVYRESLPPAPHLKKRKKKQQQQQARGKRRKAQQEGEEGEGAADEEEDEEKEAEEEHTWELVATGT
eukprot:jgi/Bigna1/141106/aug1.60_g15814